MGAATQPRTRPDARAGGGGRRFRIAHAEDPARPGHALCGVRLGGAPTTPAAERCIVCRDLSRRTFFGR